MGGDIDDIDVVPFQKPVVVGVDFGFGIKFLLPYARVFFDEIAQGDDIPTRLAIGGQMLLCDLAGNRSGRCAVCNVTRLGRLIIQLRSGDAFAGKGGLELFNGRFRFFRHIVIWYQRAEQCICSPRLTPLNRRSVVRFGSSPAKAGPRPVYPGPDNGGRRGWGRYGELP